LPVAMHPLKRNRKRPSKIAGIVFGHVPPTAPLDEKDVLIEVDSVAQSLKRLGYKPVRFPATLAVSDLLARIHRTKPAFLFNLVESLQGHDRLSYLVPSVFDAEKIPYTGVSGDAQIITTNKLIAKAILASHAIPTPQWQSCSDIAAQGIKIRCPVIIKPCASGASLGISDASIINDKNALLKESMRRSKAGRNEFFAEEFIDGREFNVSVISNFDREPSVLPPAEIIFHNYPKHKPRIVGYKAKWAENSFEFSNTRRTFDFPSADGTLIQSLKKLSLACWKVFGLNGYARVDFRIDRLRRPWVLEINGNPCISPDAGFVAAATKAGIKYDGLIDRIIANLANAYAQI